MNPRCWLAIALLATLGAYGRGSGASERPTLTFEDRVRAQEAIERVYYGHLVGQSLPFEEVVPRSTIERKVRLYLRQSAALAQRWSSPLTADDLRGELERMARGTLMPERLGELYAALGNDSLLVEECLVRPILADRRARTLFANDRTIHAGPRAEAERLWAGIATGRISPHESRNGRSTIEIIREGSPSAAGALGPPPGLTDNESPGVQTTVRQIVPAVEFETWLARFAGVPAAPALDEEDGHFLVHALLDRGSDRILAATYAVPKRSWDEWWSETEGTLDERAVTAQGVPGEKLPRAKPQAEGVSGTTMARMAGPGALEILCLPDDTWDDGLRTNMPGARNTAAAVWTGSHMIVWGGYNSSYDLNTGGVYDPATDSWTQTTITNAPQGRRFPTAVWTGTKMIVWGGHAQYSSIFLNTGGVYDPFANSWTPTSTINAPSPRREHTMVWTGSKVLVWGGWSGSISNSFNTGGVYDPQTDTWTPTAIAGAPAARARHVAVWTGSRMLAWGGYNGSVYPSEGGIYDPSTDSWTVMATANQPTVREYGTACLDRLANDRFRWRSGGDLRQHRWPLRFHVQYLAHDELYGCARGQRFSLGHLDWHVHDRLGRLHWRRLSQRGGAL